MINLKEKNKEYLRLNFEGKKDKYGIVYSYVYSDMIWLKHFNDGSAAYTLTGYISDIIKFNSLDEALDSFIKEVEK